MGEGGLQRPDRLLDKPRTVVERHDGYLGDRPVRQYLLGQSRFHLLDLRLYVIDNLQGVGAIAGYDHSAHGLHTLLVQPSPSGSGADIHERHVRYANRYAFPNGDDGILYIFYILDIPQAPDQVLHLVDLHRLGADIEVALLDGAHDIHHGDVEGIHGIRVQLDLVLLHEAARRGNLGYPLGGG